MRPILFNTELNCLRIIICLRKSEFLLKEFQFVISLKIGRAWHTLSAYTDFKVMSWGKHSAEIQSTSVGNKN